MTPTPRRSRFTLLAAAALGSVLLGTAGIAAAQSDSGPASVQGRAPMAAPLSESEAGGRPRGDQAPLAADSAAKVKAAALAAFTVTSVGEGCDHDRRGPTAPAAAAAA